MRGCFFGMWVSELLVTCIFVVVVVPMLIGGHAKATKLQLAGWVTVTSPFYWLLVEATVTVVVWVFRR